MSEIKAEMARRGLTQQQMADATGVTREAYGRYLNGRRSMPMETFFATAAAFELTPAELMERAWPKK